MARLFRTILASSVVAALALVVGAAPAGAAPAGEVTPLTAGWRLANGDGDTAGKCLDGRNTNGWVYVFPCNNAGYQDWTFLPASPTGYWYIKPRYVDECIEDVGGSVQGQQARTTMGCWKSSQAWRQIWYGNWFQLKNYYTGRCLDVRDYGTSSVVQTWPCLNQGNQKWKWH